MGAGEKAIMKAKKLRYVKLKRRKCSVSVGNECQWRMEEELWSGIRTKNYFLFLNLDAIKMHRMKMSKLEWKK